MNVRAGVTLNDNIKTQNTIKPISQQESTPADPLEGEGRTPTPVPVPEPSELSPTTTGAIYLFDRLEANARAKGHRAGVRQFATIEQRDNFLESEKRLGVERTKAAIDAGLKVEATSRKSLVCYVAKYGLNGKVFPKGKSSPVVRPEQEKSAPVVTKDGAIYV